MAAIRSQFGPEIIDASGATAFRKFLNSAHFEFRHHLADHPLLSQGQLAELAERMTAGGAGRHVVDFSLTREDPARKFDQLRRRDGAGEALCQIETGSSWLKLSFVQNYDPRYRAIHDQILEDAAAC